MTYNLILTRCSPWSFNPIREGGGGESAPLTFSPVTPVILALSSPDLVTFPKKLILRLLLKFEVDRKSLRGSTEALKKFRFLVFSIFSRKVSKNHKTY